MVRFHGHALSLSRTHLLCFVMYFAAGMMDPQTMMLMMANPATRMLVPGARLMGSEQQRLLSNMAAGTASTSSPQPPVMPPMGISPEDMKMWATMKQQGEMNSAASSLQSQQRPGL